MQLHRAYCINQIAFLQLAKYDSIILDQITQASQMAKERIRVPEALVPYVLLLIRLYERGQAQSILELIKESALPSEEPRSMVNPCGVAS